MTRRWLSWRVFPGGPGRDDWAVGALLRPLCEVVAADPELHSWFFIRYFDERGPHLRVRVLTKEPYLPAAQAVIEPLFDAALARADDHEPPSTATLVRVPDTLLARGVHLGWEHAVYEPEREKYGGLAGVRIAEGAFATASGAIVDGFASAPPDGPEQRAAIAVDLLGTTMRRVLGDGEQADALTRRYIVYWTHGESVRGRAVRARLEDALATVSHAVLARADLPPAWRRANDRIAGAVANACALEAELTGDPGLHLLHHLHMNNNRLGIPTVEEGLVARLATRFPVRAGERDG